MHSLGFITLLVYTFMLIGVEKYRMYAVPFAAAALILVYLKKKKLSVGNLKIFLTYLGILAGGYIFNLLSESGRTGGEYFFMINTIFFFPFIFLNFIESTGQLRTVRNIMIGAGTVLAILCIREYYGYYLMVRHNPDLLIYFRAGSFEKYFYTGVLLMVCGTMGVSKLYLEEIRWGSWREKIGSMAVIASLILIFEGMLMTKTRAAIYTFILGYLLILFYRFRIKRAFIFICALLLIYSANPSHIRNYSESVTIKSEQEGYRQESDNQRRVLWAMALDVWKTAPVLGVGSDIKVVKKHLDEAITKREDSQGYISGNMKGEDFRKRFTESHSMYLNILMQSGILILIFLTLFAYLIPEQFYKNYRKIRELYLIKKMGSHKIGDRSCLEKTDIELYDSINAGAMFSIINLLVVGLAWDIWGWAFQVQEIFQFMLMFLIAVEMRISQVYGTIKDYRKKNGECHSEGGNI